MDEQLTDVIKHMKLNGTIGQKITHLHGLPTFTRPPSPHMQLGYLMTLYETMGPFITEMIFAFWTRVQIASSLTMIPGLRIPTRYRSYQQKQKFMGSAVTVNASMQTIVGNLIILICPVMTDKVYLKGGWKK